MRLTEKAMHKNQNFYIFIHGEVNPDVEVAIYK